MADWETVFVPNDADLLHFTDRADEADAIIAAPTLPGQLEYLKQVNRPIVLMGFGSDDFPYVHADETAIGKMAFEHLRQLGLRSFAYCGIPAAEFALSRADGFARAAAVGGFPVNVYHRTVYAEMHKDTHELQPFHTWLQSLPKPTGIFAATSEVAVVVVHHCRMMGIVVPDHLAILGVDDDEILCNLAHPRLSAIDQAPDRMGFEAAAMLDSMLKGRPRPPKPVVIQPRAVVPRGSTDIVNTDNAAVAAAIRHIRTHVEDGINVADVLKAIPMSRRGLERGFVRNVGRTIHDEITRSRIDRASYLLDHTDMPLPDVAARCGFSYPSKLSAAFKRATGLSPRAYRQRNSRQA